MVSLGKMSSLGACAWGLLVVSCRPSGVAPAGSGVLVASIPAAQAVGLTGDSRYPMNKAVPTCEEAGGGIGAFGAGRDGGARLHAGCDLYNAVGEPLFALADGVVIQSEYDFYCSTNALEVEHGRVENGRVVERYAVVRYGEIMPRSTGGLRGGAVVRKGDQIARVGKLSCYSQAMLHFEMFAGTQSGSLSGGGSYRRRGDLVNPTQYLYAWKGGRIEGGCNRAELEICLENNGGEPCYPKWGCVNNNNVNEMAAVVPPANQTTLAQPVTQGGGDPFASSTSSTIRPNLMVSSSPVTNVTCNRTQLNICLEYNGGMPCYPKWGCVAP